MATIIVGCETSGEVRRRLHQRGHHVTSVDVLPADDGAVSHSAGTLGFHVQEDLFRFIAWRGYRWDAAVLHPDCTFLTCSGLHWNKNSPARAALTEKALAFVTRCWNLDIPRMVLENPQGCINTRLPFMPRPQYVQPYQFGDDASKRTGLWKRGVPDLVIDPAKRCAGRMVTYQGKLVERWANQTDSGQNRLGPSEDRWKLRSATYPGLADALVDAVCLSLGASIEKAA